jgi:hypothetical protein
MKVSVRGIGLVMPGVENWQQAQAVFETPLDFDVSAPLPPVTKSLLPANERRRTTALIQMSLHAAEEAVRNIGEPLATVFASSCGDLHIVDKIMQALTLPSRPVSPTHFHNSVHNASSGYWSILSGSTAASTSISAWNESFSVGLVEAATQVLSAGSPVLLVAYDYPSPDRLADKRQISAPYAVALVIASQGEGLQLNLSIEQSVKTTAMESAALENLRLANPAARSLPLMQALIRSCQTEVLLPYTNDQCLKVIPEP